MAELICTNPKCDGTWLVHSGHLWRYYTSVIARRKCPKCDSRGHPSRLAKRDIKSRGKEVKDMRIQNAKR